LIDNKSCGRDGVELFLEGVLGRAGFLWAVDGGILVRFSLARKLPHLRGCMHCRKWRRAADVRSQYTYLALLLLQGHTFRFAVWASIE